MRTLAAGVKELLDADSSLVAYDGEVPRVHADRYVVFYATSPLPRSSRSGGGSGTRITRVTTLCVGLSPNECRWVAEHTQAALDGHIPTGSAVRLKLTSAGQVRPDFDVDPTQWVCTDVWTAISAGV